MIQSDQAFASIPPALRTFTVYRVNSVPGGSHVRLIQEINGIPVYGSETVISMNSDNEVSMIHTSARKEVAVDDLNALVTPSEALRMARSFIEVAGEVIEETKTPTTVIFEDQSGKDHLAYRVHVVCSDPMGDWEVLVDAMTGDLLLKEDRFAQRQYTQGAGYVYLPDPISAAGATYGSAGMSDDNDQDTWVLTEKRSLVTLDSIQFADGKYTLNGPSCTIADIEAPHYPEDWTAASPTGFDFTRSERGFEAVNAFYHISTSYNYLVSLGFPIPSLRNLRVDPHGYDGEDNSHYSPTGNWIAFGEGGVDDAEDAEVILHEYAHAIQHQISPNWAGGETRALGEGFGDYWAASYSRSLENWTHEEEPYHWLFKWDGHNEFWGGRILNDQRTYPFGDLSIHEAGQTWSSALMGIWGDLGKEITDRLVIKSQFYLGYGATAEAAATAILQADRDLYDGAHIPTLVHWLGTVKKFIDPIEEIPLLSHDPLSRTNDLDGPYEIIVTIDSRQEIPDGATMLYWERAGTIHATPMTKLAGTNNFVAEIPGDGTEGQIRYYVLTADTHGAPSATPYGAPESTFVLDVTRSLAEVPEEFALHQNYPNPFNPATTISFALPEEAFVTLDVYDILGRPVVTLLNQPLSSGSHSVVWNAHTETGTMAASGTYVYRMTARKPGTGMEVTQIRKMVFLK